MRLAYPSLMQDQVIEASPPGSPDADHSAPIAVLLRAGHLTPPGLARARRGAFEAGETVESALTRLGLVSEREMADAFCQALGLSLVTSFESAEAQLPLPGITHAFLRHGRVLPLRVAETVLLAMANPLDDEAVQAVALFAGRAVVRCVALPTDLDAALDRMLGHAASDTAIESNDAIGTSDLERLRESASDAPVIRYVSALLARAVDERASDIHLEPLSDKLTVRLRIDGILRETDPPSPRLGDAVVSRLKVMARLDIAERRLPQDGRISAAIRGQEVDFRIATLPTAHGESVVVRVLDREQVQLDFIELGFDQAALDILRPLLALPHGILFVTGPTGSGKTTTLYAALSELNVPERKLMTVEDPIEYQLVGVQQVQVQPAIGLTFARTLRSFLRHNPNVVMVGEIRDLETAQVAVQVALTGHAVLSTLHTNDAASGVTRLLDMGIEDYLLVSTCNAFMAQRLVRRLCTACRAPQDVSGDYLRRLGLIIDHAATVYRATGCTACRGSGYHGRTTILEILPMTDTVRALVLRHATANEIHRAALAEGMRSMQAYGLQKALAGQTTIDEVLSVTRTA